MLSAEGDAAGRLKCRRLAGGRITGCRGAEHFGPTLVERRTVRDQPFHDAHLCLKGFQLRAKLWTTRTLRAPQLLFDGDKISHRLFKSRQALFDWIR